MEREDYKRLEAQYNEGILFGVLAATGKMIELLLQHNSWMLPKDRQQAIASFKIAAQNMLAKRGLVPTRYEAIRFGEDVELDFDLRL